SNLIGRIEPSRPITKWTMQISYLHGPVIDRVSGGAARMFFYVPWDGLVDGGLKAFSGAYAWSAQASVPGSTTVKSLGHGIVNAYCGRIPFRSEDCDGRPALLLISRQRGLTHLQAFWHEGTLSGQLRGRSRHGYDGDWPECSRYPRVACVRTFVPFGDFNGDRFGDLLAKYSDGTMRAFFGHGEAQFDGAKSVRVGRSWSNITMVAAPGDLNADGRPDLVARDRAGRLWLYRGTGHSRFMKRVLMSGGWNKYDHLVGAGNLTGTGATAETGPGSILAVTKSGAMWRFTGNGHAGFTKAVRVSGAWSRYNAIVGIGDLNHDARNDLVARDRSGNLWFFAGTGRGGFAGRKLLNANFGHWRAMY
ncbi:MAG: VCBS repeat-containing protein, partial [Nocardiopsaceae bacterium]|nr:VCBS repeat-containing protein [Nocardiopsaceae bacterium]